MKLLSRDMLESISFKSLRFVKPFSEIADSNNQYKGKVVFLKGVTKIPGVIVTRYLDNNGITRYRFASIDVSLNSAANSVYKFLSKDGIEKIEFAFVPTETRNHSRLLRAFRKDCLTTPLDNHFEIVRPWLELSRDDAFPVDQLLFRKPFIKNAGFYARASVFNGYDGRAGWYLIKEHLPKEGTTAIVYVGKSVGVLRCRIKDKFYPNPHLYYEEIEGEKEYSVSVIEVNRFMTPKRKPFARAVKEYEDILIGILKPRDNKAGVGRENTSIEKGYEPFYKGKGLPF